MSTYLDELATMEFIGCSGEWPIYKSAEGYHVLWGGAAGIGDPIGFEYFESDEEALDQLARLIEEANEE